LQSKELATEAALARVRATNQEREKRLQQVLSQALPALEAVASSKSVLSASEREALLNLEASLRDDIRGRRLNSELVKEASAAARARGVQVILLDEGGLDAITETQLTNVLNKVVHALNSVHAGKIVIRSPKSEKWLVTVMATRPGTQVPDLWLKF
jgi:2-phospho-L-lactate guanylyltransferase (CobY/MobA/RfbA family)